MLKHWIGGQEKMELFFLGGNSTLKINHKIYEDIKKHSRYICHGCDLYMSNQTFEKMNSDKAFDIRDGYVLCPNKCGKFLRDRLRTV